MTQRKYHVGIQTTQIQNYTVLASSETEAKKLVKEGKVFADGEAKITRSRCVCSWPLADQTLPAGNE